MTPFNPEALLVMLLTFYPDVSADALARARRERPDYFAGGVLGGSHGDKMTLPDGSGWDLIFDVENATGARRWQVIQPGPAGDAGDPIFALEPGPLVPIDLAQWELSVPQPVFLPLVAGHLSELGASDTLLANAASTVAETGAPGVFDAAVSGPLTAGDVARAQQLGAADQAVPDDVLQATIAADGVFDANERDTEFAPPPLQNPLDPGPAPTGGPVAGDQSQDAFDPGDREHP